MMTCPCARPAHTSCFDCGRKLCVWHHALSPRVSAGILKAVCYPACKAPWWKPFLAVKATQAGGVA